MTITSRSRAPQANWRKKMAALEPKSCNMSMFRPVERNWMLSTASTTPATVPKPPV